MRYFRSILATLVVFALVSAACGDDDSAATTIQQQTTQVTSTTAPPTTTAAPTTTAGSTTTTEAPTTTTTAAPTTTEAAMLELPDTPVVATVDTSYTFGANPGVATDDDLPFALGSIQVHWYRGGGFYIAVYQGLDLDATGPLCPGNSAQTANGFEFISNAPSPGATCEGAPTIAEAPHGVMVCNGLVSYVTLIPDGTEGALFGSVEIYSADANNAGASGFAAADPAAMPEVDPASLDC
ncbi:hypothetical protein HQ535_10790 [bacterium]|nr:hypothetical protein [bacterium]